MSGPAFFGFTVVVLIVCFILVVIGIKNLIYICAPNEVMIFSGRRRRVGDKIYGYRLIKGGRGTRWPLIETVDKMDLTNIVIDISAQNAYSKGGIPLTVQGVANVKIAGHEPLLNNAIERFLGRSRTEILQIAKATLEGALRGILATMTPEEVNEDKLLFAERLVAEVEQDMTSLGLVVDTMKIQNVQDDVKYLDSIGRRRNAEIVSKARIAEAIASADAHYREAENLEQETKAQINAQIQIAKADAEKRLRDAQTRRAALVAEEQAQVAAMVAQSKAEVDVQKARLEQMRGKLEADVIQPAKAAAESAEAAAKAQTAPIIEDARARAEALRKLATTWQAAGPNARQVLMSQKLESVIGAVVDVIPETNVEKVTMIDGMSASNGNGFPGKTIGTLEQIKQIFGIDVVEKLQGLGNGDAKQPSAAKAAFESKPEQEPQQPAQPQQDKPRNPAPPPKVQDRNRRQ